MKFDMLTIQERLSIARPRLADAERFHYQETLNREMGAGNDEQIARAEQQIEFLRGHIAELEAELEAQPQ